MVLLSSLLVLLLLSARSLEGVRARKENVERGDEGADDRLPPPPAAVVVPEGTKLAEKSRDPLGDCDCEPPKPPPLPALAFARAARDTPVTKPFSMAAWVETSLTEVAVAFAIRSSTQV